MTDLLKESNSKLHQAYDKLEKIAMTDGLTNIFNRRYFDEIYRKEWSRSLRTKDHISIILIDIDYFKKYNDTYGHQKGDECLKKVAGSLKNTIRRSSDLIARYGGEEFIALLSNTDINGAAAVAKKIKTGITSLKIEHETSVVAPYLTLSMGYSCIVPNSRIHRDKLVDTADKALYKSKKSGRNRHTAYTQEIIPG